MHVQHASFFWWTWIWISLFFPKSTSNFFSLRKIIAKWSACVTANWNANLRHICPTCLKMIVIFSSAQICAPCHCCASRFNASSHILLQLIAARISHSRSQSNSLGAFSSAVCLRLERWDNEEYVFTLPTAYARSILSVPWVELGDKVSLSCPKSKYSATALFHVKVSQGGAAPGDQKNTVLSCFVST